MMKKMKSLRVFVLPVLLLWAAAVSCRPSRFPDPVQQSEKYQQTLNPKELVLSTPQIQPTANTSRETPSLTVGIMQEETSTKPPATESDGYEHELPEQEIVELFDANCTDENRMTRALGEEWVNEVDNEICTCSKLGWILASIDASNFNIPYLDCKLNGCRRWDKKAKEGKGEWKVLQPGDEFTDDRGWNCLCVDGPDPQLMDYDTLYHLECEQDEVNE